MERNYQVLPDGTELTIEHNEEFTGNIRVKAVTPAGTLYKSQESHTYNAELPAVAFREVSRLMLSTLRPAESTTE